MIKFFDSHFDDYIISNKKNNYHPELNKEINKLPKYIEKLNNILFYGKNGIGKYTQVLKIIFPIISFPIIASPFDTDIKQLLIL
jgi:signal recognition particle GTPase